jgi:hypothetical protein
MRGDEKWGDGENDNDKKQEEHEEDDCSEEKGGVEQMGRMTTIRSRRSMRKMTAQRRKGEWSRGGE